MSGAHRITSATRAILFVLTPSAHVISFVSPPAPRSLSLACSAAVAAPAASCVGVASGSPRSLALACSAAVAAPAASTGSALGGRGRALGRILDVAVRPSRGLVSQAESAPCASPRVSRRERSSRPATRSRFRRCCGGGAFLPSLSRGVSRPRWGRWPSPPLRPHQTDRVSFRASSPTLQSWLEPGSRPVARPKRRESRPGLGVLRGDPVRPSSSGPPPSSDPLGPYRVCFRAF